eukprot:403336964
MEIFELSQLLKLDEFLNGSNDSEVLNVLIIPFVLIALDQKRLISSNQNLEKAVTNFMNKFDTIISENQVDRHNNQKKPSKINRAGVTLAPISQQQSDLNANQLDEISSPYDENMKKRKGEIQKKSESQNPRQNIQGGLKLQTQGLTLMSNVQFCEEGRSPLMQRFNSARKNQKKNQ